MSASRRYAATTALAAVALLSSGCGGEAAPTAKEPKSDFGRQTAAQIRSAATTDMANIDSVTIAGDVPDQEMEFTVSLDSHGNCGGTVTAGDGKGQVVESESGSFVKGDELFWNAFVGPEEAAQMMAVADDAWVRTPRAAGYFLPQCDFSKFVPLLTAGNASAEKGEEREIHGIPAISLTSSEKGVTSSMWIATSAPHYLLEITTKGGKDAGTFTLSGFNDPVEAAVPADAKVIDLAPTRQKAE